jgi:glyoxylase-like metal-dependent hydrolase (beta-lactamase superfamily II)
MASDIERVAESFSTGGAAPANDLFTIQRVTQSVYAAIARPAAILNCNAAIIVGRDYVTIVDTHSKPSAALALIRQVKAEITTLPVRYVVNTHFHWDHSDGNNAYGRGYGTGVEIVSSAPTREWIARHGRARLRETLEALPGQIEALKARLAHAPAGDRDLLVQRIAELQAYLDEMLHPSPVLPTITFDQRLVLWAGELEIHLLFLGRGHTAGDALVYVPEQRVIATGDLLHGILPHIGDGYPDEWPDTLGRLGEIEFDWVAPGHGSVQEGKATLLFFRNYLEEINDAVVRGIERGAPLVELQGSITTTRLRSLNSDGDGARIRREIESVFGRAWVSESVLEEGVAKNIGQIHDFYKKKRTAIGRLKVEN